MLSSNSKIISRIFYVVNYFFSAHTVTSGLVLTGPDGNFDSGLIRPGETFSNMFDESGTFRYFCMIHPWAEGSVTVE